MRMLRFLLLVACLLPGCLAGRGQAHDLPAALAVTGFFDATGERPELVLRVPLIMLTNVNLPKRGSGYIDLARMDEGITRAERAVIEGFGLSTGGRDLVPATVASRISLPSERNFDDLGAAVAHIAGPPLPVERNVFWNQGFFDVHMVFEPQPAEARYTLRPRLPPGIAERTIVTLAVIAPGKPLRRLSLDGSVEQIGLDPSWWQAGAIFVRRGIEHILTGYDHLLFLLCLILPLRRDFRRLAAVVTAFTIGHSTTLIPAGLGLIPATATFASNIEVLIAASIVYMAVDNVVGAGTHFRWALAFGFGLIHGFGFASTLSDALQFAGGHLVVSLVSFNIGIEAGQILLLVLVLPVLAQILRTERQQRIAVILVSVVAGHQAWHWMTERLV